MHDMWLEEDMNEAVKTLQKGGVILYPTDTIWGIGCSALDAEAIARIYKIKKRDPDKPFIVLMSDLDMLKHHVTKMHPRIETLLTLHHRPLTVIYPEVTELPETVKSEKGTVAIRITQDPFCKTLIDKIGFPIISTSANIAGDSYPQGFGEISLKILKKVDYVVKHRQSERYTGVPSVIAQYNYKGQLEFLRS